MRGKEWYGVLDIIDLDSWCGNFMLQHAASYHQLILTVPIIRL